MNQPNEDPIKAKPVPILDKQAIVAMGLLLAGYLAYQAWVVVPRQQKYQAWLASEQARVAAEADAAAVASDQAQAAPPTSQTPAQVADAGSGDAPQPEATDPADDDPAEQRVTLDTPEFTVELSTAGASVSELTFKHLLGSTYEAVLEEGETDDQEKTPYQPLHAYSKEVRSLGLEPFSGTKEFAWVGQTTRWRHSALDGGAHRFTLDLPNGLQLIKTYAPPSHRSDADEAKLHSYHFDLTVEVRNPTGEAQTFDGYWLNGPAGMEDRTRDRMAGLGSEAIATARIDDEFELTTWHTNTSEIQDLDEASPSLGSAEAPNGISYFGAGTHYFVALVVPRGEGVQVEKAEAMGLLKAVGQQPTQKQKDAEGGIGSLAVVRGLIDGKTLAPNESLQHSYMVYVGPRQKNLLDNDESPYAGYGLEEVTDFGIFDSFASLLLTFLIGLHGIVGNWGFSVILLTFLVRGLMLPMSIWSQRNMLRMQKIAPEMAKLKEKFAKPDGSMTPEQQRQFSSAQMELMRKHKVNPLGCAGPIFLQMPIFFGLWKALNYSFELRHTPFVGWVHDLSAPDVVTRLPFTLPLLGTDALSIFPLLMVVTYFFQQQIQPKATDPKQAEQQKMMRVLFPIFGLFLYKFPSGLMLYFITSALWSITEMATVKKWIQQQEEAPKGKPAAARS